MVRRPQAKRSAARLVQARPGSHVALLYQEPTTIAEAVAFAAAGPLEGASCAVLAYARLAERIVAQVRDLHGLDVRRLQADGALVFLECRPSAREVVADLARFLERAGGSKRPARMLLSLGWGEAGWPDHDELLRIEASLSQLCSESKAAALCLYDARQLPGSVLLEGGLACHPLVHWRGEPRKNPFVVAPSVLGRELAARRKGESRLRAWTS